MRTVRGKMDKELEHNEVYETIKRGLEDAVNGRVTEHSVSVMHEIDNAPTIDAVPVVRCKECKYWEEESTFCLNKDGCYGSETTADWFCADGERKDGAEMEGKEDAMP